MSKNDPDIPDLDGVLADAIESLRESPVSEDLVARCRANAIALAERKTEDGFSSESIERIESAILPNRWIADWARPMALAASVVLLINFAQAVARLPAPDRQVTAIERLINGDRVRLYSDLVIEPISESVSSNPRSKS